METVYKTLLFYDIVKFVAEYLDNTLIKYESDYKFIAPTILTDYKTKNLMLFKIKSNHTIEVVHNLTDKVIFSYLMTSKVL